MATQSSSSTFSDGRVPPHSTEAEQSVLGAMMLDEHVVPIVIDMLTPACFYHHSHRFIFSAAITLFEKQTPIDIVTVATELSTKDTLESAGGAAYLAELSTHVPTTANAEYYAKVVHDHWLTRELIVASQEISAICYKGDIPVEDMLESAQKNVFDISQHKNRAHFEKLGKMMVSVIDYIEELHKKKGAVTGLDTGFKQLNDYTTGFHKGELIIIAARPAMGKTAFVLNIAEHISTRENTGVAIFSLEMTAQQLAMRLLSSHARVEGQRLRKGSLRKQDFTHLMNAGSVLQKAELYIDASPQLSPLELRARCRRLQSEVPNLGLVIVDYIQLMEASGRGIDSRQQEIAYISRSLKAMAMELEIPVIALSQLNRESEKGAGGKATRPQLSQLRESGAIEQDADVVMLLYRPGYYSDDPQYKNHAEVIIAKQRNGPTGIVHLQFLDSFALFTDPPEGYSASFDDE
jgi:replicative DNA helicase